MEPPINGHIGDERFVHCSEVVPSLDVKKYYNVQGVSSLSWDTALYNTDFSYKVSES